MRQKKFKLFVMNEFKISFIFMRGTKMQNKRKTKNPPCSTSKRSHFLLSAIPAKSPAI